MSTPQLYFSAGQTIKLNDVGNFYRILEASRSLTIRVFKNGQVISEAVNIDVGYAEQFVDHFDGIEIFSEFEQMVNLAIRYGSMVYQDGSASNNKRSPSQVLDSDPFLVNDVAALILPNDLFRLSVRFYNASGGYIYLGGAGATVDNCAIRIAPEQTYFDSETAGVAWYAVSRAEQLLRIQSIF